MTGKRARADAHTNRRALRIALKQALAWRQASGWPGRNRDLALAAKRLVAFHGPLERQSSDARWHADFAWSLYADLVRRHGGQTARHRLVLCLVLARVLLRSSAPSGDYLGRFPGRLS